MTTSHRFPPVVAGHPCPILRAMSLSLQGEPPNIGKGFSARPYQGVRKSVWDPETSRERVGDWGGPETVWALFCVAARCATRPNGEGG